MRLLPTPRGSMRWTYYVRPRFVRPSRGAAGAHLRPIATLLLSFSGCDARTCLLYPQAKYCNARLLAVKHLASLFPRAASGDVAPCEPPVQIRAATASQCTTPVRWVMR